MAGRGWTFVEFCENLLADHSSDIDVVFLEEQEVRVALDANVGELDPLVVGDVHLVEVLNETVVVCDMRAGLRRDQDVRHLADLSELVDSAGL